MTLVNRDAIALIMTSLQWFDSDVCLLQIRSTITASCMTFHNHYMDEPALRNTLISTRLAYLRSNTFASRFTSSYPSGMQIQITVRLFMFGSQLVRIPYSTSTQLSDQRNPMNTHIRYFFNQIKIIDHHIQSVYYSCVRSSPQGISSYSIGYKRWIGLCSSGRRM